MRFTKVGGNLVITVTAQEQGELLAQEDLSSDGAFFEAVEHELCNSTWEFVRPEEVGALTDSLILSDEAERDDRGELVNIGRVYWFPAYEVRSPLRDLANNGTVTFKGVE